MSDDLTTLLQIKIRNESLKKLRERAAELRRRPKLDVSDARLCTVHNMVRLAIDLGSGPLKAQSQEATLKALRARGLMPGRRAGSVPKDRESVISAGDVEALKDSEG